MQVAPAQASAETVLITGASQGIGLEFARQYAARGATVIATHRSFFGARSARRAGGQVSQAAHRAHGCNG